MKTFNEFYTQIQEKVASAFDLDYKSQIDHGKTKTGHNVKKVSTGTVYQKDMDSVKKDEPKAAPARTDGKRGRGRPPGKYGQYKKKVEESIEIIEGLETEEEIEQFIDSLDEESYLALEEVLELNEEQLDELSKKTLGNYIKANQNDTRGLAKGLEQQRNDPKFVQWYARQLKNRKTGVKRAVDKLTKEEVEPIDELSKKTLGSYINKAVKNKSYKDFLVGSLSTGNKASVRLARKNEKKSQKRSSGIATATNKLTKEENEE
jgi:hypothetical protein